ncbi:MAG: DUF11 domain-containing protein [Clostridia bacterium]|nr:DUF11 domain-containing protein [Clostridia bacterium]
MATFTNQATLSYNNNVRNSNIVTGEILDAISITKTAAQDSYRQGDSVTYVINIVNSGTTNFTNLTVTDNLGAYTTPDGTGTAVPLTYNDGTVRYFVNGVPQTTPAAVAGPPLQITGIDVPAGGNATIIYTADTNEFTPLGEASTLVNTAEVTGTGIAAQTQAQETLAIETAPNLSITKSVNPTVIRGNEPLTYTFVVTNTGNEEADATDNLIISDTFNPRLDISEVAVDGTALTPGGEYNYNEATGEFATVGGRVTVPPAQYTQDPATGAVTITPGISTVTVTGTVVN